MEVLSETNGEEGTDSHRNNDNPDHTHLYHGIHAFRDDSPQ